MSQLNPLIPMGALTGNPSQDMISEMLQKYRDLGLDQYLIYPRSGCELEYLSEEYFNTVEIICKEAERIGFKALWLYDEFNWPSGSCAYAVPKINKKFAAKLLCAVQTSDGIKVEVRCNELYTDLMDPEAVDCFIKLTHERYFQRLGKWFGTLIKGIFTDEPEICYAGSAAKGTIFCMGYYNGLEDDYRNITNGDLFADIAAGLRANQDFYPKVCAKLLAERFRKSYVDRVQSWCEKHNITLTGHLMDETSAMTSRKSCGEILKVLPGFGLPGMDEINTRMTIAGSEWLTLATAMHAIDQRGNQGGLAELFALGPCDLSFAKLNKMLYLTAAFGVDHYVLAIAANSPRGCAVKTLYYNSFGFDQPHMELYRDWGKEAVQAAKIASLPRSYEIAVRYSTGEMRMTDLLPSLVKHQISWCLLAEDEAPDESLPMVLTNLANGCVCEEKSGSVEVSFDYLWEAILQKKIQLSSIVCDHSGKMVEDIFIRRYADKSVLVIDMSETSRELFLHRDGKKIKFDLYANGTAYISADADEENFLPSAAEKPAAQAWQLEFDRPHLQRVQFNNDNIMEFDLAQAQTLKLALRQYAGAAEVALDGKILNGGTTASNLPETFNELYTEVDLGNVSAGKHVLQLVNDAPDYPFLPLAVLIGSDLADYVGSFVQKTVLDIPQNVEFITLDHVPAPGAVELFINGIPQGKLLQLPYKWQLEDVLKGAKAEITLKRWTTVAGLFKTPWRGADDRSRYLQETRAPQPQKITPLEIVFTVR